MEETAMTKILIVDDDVAYNQALKDCLECEGYEVISADDGLHGFTLYQEQLPDLVITDLIMPNEDGMGLILKIGEEVNCSCKIIVISGGGRIGAENYLETAKVLPKVYQVLEKPFRIDELLNCIENWRQEMAQEHMCSK